MNALGGNPGKTRGLSTGRRIALFCCWAVALLTLAIAIVVGPDALREVQEPDLELMALFDEASDKESGKAQIGGPANKSLEDNDLGDGEIRLRGTQERLHEIRDQLRKEFRAFDNIEQLPAEYRDIARRFNEAGDKFVAEAIEFLPQAVNMSSQEASIRLRAILSEFTRPTEDLFHQIPRDYYGDMWAGSGYMDAFGRIQMTVFAKQENWGWAAEQAKRMGDWDAEVFYARKNGLSGFGYVAVRSLGRAYGSVKDRIVGPDDDAIPVFGTSR